VTVDNVEGWPQPFNDAWGKTGVGDRLREAAGVKLGAPKRGWSHPSSFPRGHGIHANAQLTPTPQPLCRDARTEAISLAYCAT